MERINRNVSSGVKCYGRENEQDKRLLSPREEATWLCVRCRSVLLSRSHSERRKIRIDGKITEMHVTSHTSLPTLSPWSPRKLKDKNKNIYRSCYSGGHLGRVVWESVTEGS